MAACRVLFLLLVPAVAAPPSCLDEDGYGTSLLQTAGNKILRQTTPAPQTTRAPEEREYWRECTVQNHNGKKDGWSRHTDSNMSVSNMQYQCISSEGSNLHCVDDGDGVNGSKLMSTTTTTVTVMLMQLVVMMCDALVVLTTTMALIMMMLVMISFTVMDDGVCLPGPLGPEELETPISELLAKHPGEDGWCLFGAAGTWTSKCAVCRRKEACRSFAASFQPVYDFFIPLSNKSACDLLVLDWSW
eukprot:s3207_g12.t1